MGTLGSITWPHQALTTMLPSSPATPAPTDMEPDMALRPTMPDTQEPAPTGMGILATVVLTDMELAMVVLTELAMRGMELAMVVRTELAMLGMELAMAMAILATPATAPSLRTALMVMELAILATPATAASPRMVAHMLDVDMVQPTQDMLDIEFRVSIGSKPNMTAPQS